MARAATTSGRGPGRPPLTDAQRQEIRLRIATAALDLFTERGYEHTRVEDVAERAGVSERTLWRHVDSKSACLVPLAREAFGAGIVELVRTWPQDSTFGAHFATVVPIARAEPISLTVTRFMRLVRDERGLDAMVARTTRAVEHDLARALADRDGVPTDDITVRARAAVLNAVFRAAIDHVAAGDAEPDNDQLLSAVGRALENVSF